MIAFALSIFTRQDVAFAWFGRGLKSQLCASDDGSIGEEEEEE